jgi:hypothetical protein
MLTPAGKIYKYTVCHREEALADGRVGEWTPGNKPTSVNTYRCGGSLAGRRGGWKELRS